MMFKLKVKKQGQPTVEASYHNKHDAFTAAISHYRGENDEWGEGYLCGAEIYITAERIAVRPFTFWGQYGMNITITAVPSTD